MKLRVAIWFLLVCAGFVGGAVCFREAEVVVEKRQLAGGAAPKLTAITPRADVGGNLDKVDQVTSGTTGAAMLNYFDVVRETPVGQLGDLALEIERRFFAGGERSLGQVILKAIFARMLAEDPEGLLEFAMLGRCRFYENQLHALMDALMEEKGYDWVKAALDESPRPARAVKLMTAALRREVQRDRRVGWKHALDYGRADLSEVSAWQQGKIAAEFIVMGDSPLRFRSDTITDIFSHYHQQDPQAARQSVLKIRRADERAAALAGVGRYWVRDDLDAAQEFASRLESDQMRLEFFKGLLSDDGDAVWAPEGYRAEQLDRIAKLENGKVRDSLVLVELSAWNEAAPEKARAWAEANEQLDLYSRFESPLIESPLTNEIPFEFDFDKVVPGIRGHRSETIPEEVEF